VAHWLASRASLSRMTGSSVGIDVGGTFTDVVVRAPSGRLSSGKVPTTPASPADGVMRGLQTLAGDHPIASVAHGTTIVTNAIVEGRGAVVGLITTRGFRDVLEIARSSRLHLYDLKAAPKPPPPVPRPLALASSGPAAGVAAAAHVARTLGIPRALAFDMGGTTTDVCLISDGVAETSSQRKLGGYPVRLPMAAVESIGAGGGSIAYVDMAGALRVGPRSAGAQPGPACYGLGGVEPTVTDATLTLGYLDPARVYGRAIRLDRERARVALDTLARRLGLSLLETAGGMIEVANAAMLRALRLVSVQRGYDLRDFTL